MIQPTNAIRVGKYKSIYEAWLTCLKPLHKLSSKEIEVAAWFLEQYIKKKGNITDEALLNQFIFSAESKRNIKKILNMSSNYFQVLFKVLKSKGFIINNERINPKYIPAFNNDGDIILCYIIKNNANNQLEQSE